MRPFDACLLDYGNTIIQFDRPQIDYVRVHLANAISRIVGPARLPRVAECLDEVCMLPFIGSPPTYRELTPAEQMDRFLRLVYGSDREFSDETIRECDAILQDLFVQIIAPDESAVQLISRLRTILPVGLVSNYPCGVALRRALRKTRLDGLLDPIVISGEVGYVKPHESVFRAALDPLGVSPERVLFVGDRWDADMVGASQAGMKTCHHVGFTSDVDLEARYEVYTPDFRIRSLEEIEPILLGRRAPEDCPTNAGVDT